MNVNVTMEYIVESYRVTKKRTAPIVTMMKNVEKKKEIYRRLKEIKTIKLNECKLEGGPKSIYINDDLTVTNQHLFKAAREIKKEKGYKTVYSIGGKIYLRKTED